MCQFNECSGDRNAIWHSEIHADVEAVQFKAVMRVEDVTFHETHAEVLLRFSKTDQFGKGRSVFLPQASGERCPIQSLKAWLAVAGIETGWLFRSVTKGGLVSDDPMRATSVMRVPP